ncbi:MULTISPECIES: hypothetical protein [unclassified Gilliamella]|uniref:hypothetical protein n=1 Tax=unclassified Gilliamella TaxID=2685620 RepID=UPI002269A119|nr:MULTISPECIES: hypothetical protein [unclassified Gilliamella]MCX8574530.1 hypothetical protein [Gilliamella sp. B3831]MCX8576761.1 hypothetical protein [Gilliamella sp. B3815]MCX8589257.1 hypothetical protein [Gilliamella sp. B3812]MCX8603831.1 hypothetical protein [Gilliamella sp. B3823]MCX8606711.1 hypothetical protein [Gilliamella sp. B3825]
MLNIIIFLIGILGVALVSYGAWLILPACGFITAGCILILWSYFASKVIANFQQTTN